MSQEYRVVPAALLESALKTLAGVAPGRFAVEAELRAIIDAPVPPAGGELEVLGKIMAFGNDTDLKEVSWCKGKMPGFGVELVDRAHITRLQAKNAALQQHLNTADQRVDDFQYESFEGLYNAAIEERDAAKSEMAKARELIERADLCAALARFPDLQRDAKAFLADQSVPVAKGKGDE